MTQCPACGAEVDGTYAFCNQCGAELPTGDAGGKPGDQPPQQGGQPGGQQPGQGGGRSPGQQGGQPQGEPAGQHGGQPQGQAAGQHGGQPQGQAAGQHGGQPQGQAAGQHGGQPQGQPAPQGQPGGQGQAGAQGQPPRGGHPQQGPAVDRDRRKFLMYGGGAVALAAGGYLAYTQFLGGPSGPAGTAESFVSALNNGNQQQANSLLHQDSFRQQVSTATVSAFETAQLSIQGSEVVLQTNNRADVDVELQVTDSGFTQTITMRVELETQNGEWRVVDFSY